ncbi:MAG: aldo/keto reductase [Hyphomicrobiaceae bacterium]
MEKKSIGRTGLEVTQVCFGTSALGDMPDTYGYSVDEARARDTIRAIFDSPVNILDTSRNYGFGRSEERIGSVIRERGGLPDGFVLSNKLDRDMETNRLDGARARRSFEESLTALGVDRIQILHLHDPEHVADLDDITRKGGALDELFKIKEEGLADAVGLAMGRIDMMFSLLRDRDFDVLISHNRYTLLNRQAGELFDYADRNGIATFNAAPFAGGVLAKGSAAMPRITYQEVDEASLGPVRRIEDLCASQGLSPGAVSLGFSLQDPRITSTIVGASSPAHVAETLQWASTPIADTTWQDLAGLPYSTEDPEADRQYKPG